MDYRRTFTISCLSAFALDKKTGRAKVPLPGKEFQQSWVTATFRVTQVFCNNLKIFCLRAAWPEGTVRKLRNCLYRGLSSVRTWAKAACQHSPRAK